MSELNEKARESVIVLHQIIEKVFHGDGSYVPELLRHFSSDFTMITPGGKSMPLDEVAALFTRLTGGRQGVAITIEQCKVIARFGEEVAIQYHELQQQGENHTHRIALAVIDCGSTPPRWRYLQETMVVS
ncbi:hypothetical protein [Erwinia sorbitola]|uniref:DUF4440 domain-containing protein n=1 Tax=Erwinia sorbitola TaxID=2681984 RepID=A0A6I6EVP8_9GAMM|nr:hypothetical protein [Erwinia sorbitola]MTD26833.1 hypothetical protein [Erwinia sorbitola]QGU88403.1 hypothetical protein GN242_14755 [Erwinia sorbitola]